MATVGQGEARMVSAMEQENCVVELQQAVGQAEARMVSAIRLQRDAEESRSAAVKEQVQQAEERMGALEAGLAAQVQRAEESRSQIESQRLWVEGKWEGLVTGECQSLWRVQTEGSIAKLNADAERLYHRGSTAGERLQQVAAGVDESTKTSPPPLSQIQSVATGRDAIG